MTFHNKQIDLTSIEAVVFSGGGSRCLWQAGFFEVLSQYPGFKPKYIAAASAGATIACLILSGRATAALKYFKKVTASNKKNAYWENLFTDKPVFPHFAIYRKALLDLIDIEAFHKLQNGPEIRVQISRPPRWLGPRSGSVFGLAAYSLEKLLFYPMHPTFSSRLGYTPIVVDTHSCATIDELAELLLQSSCTPPFVPVMKRDKRPALDGGLIDNVPVKILNDVKGLKMILLSRQYPQNRIPNYPDRVYIQPSQQVTIAKWDYTNPEGLQFAYDLGKKDAENLQIR